MRMWKVDVTKMCRRHLLGEHNEMHMFAGTILKKRCRNFVKSRFVLEGLVDTSCIRERHDELAVEMLRRGYKHKTPFPDGVVVQAVNYLDIAKNEEELQRRCKECKF